METKMELARFPSTHHVWPQGCVGRMVWQFLTIEQASFSGYDPQDFIYPDDPPVFSSQGFLPSPISRLADAPCCHAPWKTPPQQTRGAKKGPDATAVHGPDVLHGPRQVCAICRDQPLVFHECPECAARRDVAATTVVP